MVEPETLDRRSIGGSGRVLQPVQVDHVAIEDSSAERRILLVFVDTRS